MGANDIHWEPRVPQHTIRRLYENDAAGIIDEALIDDVAYSLYARCESIITVTRAEHGEVVCPRCGAVIVRRDGSKAEPLRCACGWATTWGEYLVTYQKKQLSGGGAIGAFREYVARLPGAATARDKMLLIDWLIHEVHRAAPDGHEWDRWRPAACNLIEGRMNELVAFLDDLAGRPARTPEVREAQRSWRESVLPRLWGSERIARRPEQREEPCLAGRGPSLRSGRRANSLTVVRSSAMSLV